MNSTFQEKLKQIEFKTIYRGQMTTFDYDSLFANRRVIVFSITNIRTVCSVAQFKKYEIVFNNTLKNLGIDDVCAVDSTDWMIGPWVDCMGDVTARENPDWTRLKGLPDRDHSFVKLISEHYQYQKDLKDLARLWQYVIIINNGEPEKFWHNPFKADAPLKVLKNQEYRYRKLAPRVVRSYLVDNQ